MGYTIEIRKQHWNDVNNGYSDSRVDKTTDKKHVNPLFI